jgi:hypothetical protein
LLHAAISAGCAYSHPVTDEASSVVMKPKTHEQYLAAIEAPNPWLACARDRAAEIARLVRELAAMMTASDVAIELTRRGVETPQGSRRWGAATVRRTLLRADEHLREAA